MADIRVAIDRGGTFCDVIAHLHPGRAPVTFKLLSEDPANYRDAPTEAIRRVLEMAGGQPIPVGQKLDGSRVGKAYLHLGVVPSLCLFFFFLGPLTTTNHHHR